MRLAAAMVDGAVITEMRRIIGAPEVAARVIEAQRRDGEPTDERAIVAALQRFNDLWDALYPAEQARIVRLLVDRVTVGPSGMAVDLRNNGITALIDPQGRIVFELPPIATGSGIGILQTAGGNSQGDVGLFAPNGEDIALDALIRSPGRVLVAAEAEREH